MTRAPRPPRKAAPTRWARFLVEQRLERGWSQKAAFEAFRSDRGWADDSRASYGALERGQREPDSEEQRYFLDFYGVSELPAETPEPDERDALVDALNRQSEAMEELVKLLRPLVDRQDQRLAALEPVVRRLAERDLGVPTTPTVPQRTKG